MGQPEARQPGRRDTGQSERNTSRKRHHRGNFGGPQDPVREGRQPARREHTADAKSLKTMRALTTGSTSRNTLVSAADGHNQIQLPEKPLVHRNSYLLATTKQSVGALSCMMPRSLSSNTNQTLITRRGPPNEQQATTVTPLTARRCCRCYRWQPPYKIRVGGKERGGEGRNVPLFFSL
jgi:hypothetical protein